MPWAGEKGSGVFSDLSIEGVERIVKNKLEEWVWVGP